MCSVARLIVTSLQPFTGKPNPLSWVLSACGSMGALSAPCIGFLQCYKSGLDLMGPSCTSPLPIEGNRISVIFYSPATSATSTVVGCCLSACDSMGALGAPCILCLHCKVIHHPLKMYLMANVIHHDKNVVNTHTHTYIHLHTHEQMQHVHGYRRPQGMF